MKKTILPFLLIMFGTLLLTSNKPKELTKQTNESFTSAESKKSKLFCGPFFTIYNGDDFTVTSMEITHLGYPTITINNPTFPYVHDNRTGGFVNFLFYFDQSGGTFQGRIKVDEDDYSSTLTQIVCEPFDIQSMYPFSFYTSCYQYNVRITTDSSCE